MQEKLLSIIKTFVISTFFLLTQTTYASGIDKIIMFGDSISDTGNLYALTKGAHNSIPLIPIIPKDPPYYQGRFTNGQVWVEHLAKALNVKLENYAYGGSWAEPILDSWLIVPFGLDMQVNYYLVASALDFNRADHLYIIWAGANDYLNGRSDIEYATTNTVASIKKQIEWLVYYGAKNVIVINLPDLSVLPDAVSRGPAFVSQLSKLSQQHNSKLEAMIAELQKNNSNTNLAMIDVRDYYNDIMLHPEKYLIKNTKEACYTGGYMLAGLATSEEVLAAKDAKIDIMNNASLRAAYTTSLASMKGQNQCANPDEYLFWDQVHPTRVVHKAFAVISYNQLYEMGIKGIVK